MDTFSTVIAALYVVTCWLITVLGVKADLYSSPKMTRRVPFLLTSQGDSNKTCREILTLSL